jgi:hypothetical protein
MHTFVPSCEEWKDAVVMGFMVEPLPKDRLADPEAWDQKIAFWKQVVMQWAAAAPLTFLLKDLTEGLQWHGSPNPGLEDVLRIMVGKELVTPDDIVGSSKGFISFVAQGAVAYCASWIWAKALPAGRFVSKPTIKIREMQVFEKLTKDCHGTDFIQSLDSIIKKCPEYSPSDLRILLASLCAQGKAVFCTPGSSSMPIVKFAHCSQSAINLPADAAIGQLKHTILVLENQIQKVTIELGVKKQEVQQQLKNKNKQLAMFALRQKKRLDRVCEQLYGHLENATKLLSSIEDLHTSKQVVDTLGQASSALNSLQKSWNLAADTVEALMDQVAERVEDVDEVNQILSKPLTPDIDDSEFEKLMESLEVDSGPPKAPLMAEGKFSMASDLPIPSIVEAELVS